MADDGGRGGWDTSRPFGGRKIHQFRKFLENHSIFFLDCFWSQSPQNSFEDNFWNILDWKSPKKKIEHYISQKNTSRIKHAFRKYMNNYFIFFSYFSGPYIGALETFLGIFQMGKILLFFSNKKIRAIFSQKKSESKHACWRYLKNI